MTQLGPIDFEEIKPLKFQFADELDVGKTIVSVAVSVSVVSGIDATPNARLVGAAVVSGTDVIQRFQPSVPNVQYHLRVKATDSEGLVHVIPGNLQVSAF